MSMNLNFEKRIDLKRLGEQDDRENDLEGAGWWRGTMLGQSSIPACLTTCTFDPSNGRSKVNMPSMILQRRTRNVKARNRYLASATSVGLKVGKEPHLTYGVRVHVRPAFLLSVSAIQLTMEHKGSPAGHMLRTKCKTWFMAGREKAKICVKC